MSIIDSYAAISYSEKTAIAAIQDITRVLAQLQYQGDIFHKSLSELLEYEAAKGTEDERCFLNNVKSAIDHFLDSDKDDPALAGKE